MAVILANTDKYEEAVANLDISLELLEEEQRYTFVRELCRDVVAAILARKSEDEVARMLDEDEAEVNPQMVESMEDLKLETLISPADEARAIVESIFGKPIEVVKAMEAARKDTLAKQKTMMRISSRTMSTICSIAAEMNASAPGVEFVHLRFRVLYERAKAMQLVGKTREAIDDLTCCLAQKPSAAEIIFRRGFAFKELKQFDLAGHDFETAKELSEDMVYRVNYSSLGDINTIVLSPANSEPVGKLVGIPLNTATVEVQQPGDVMRSLVRFNLEMEKKAEIEREKAEMSIRPY
jgi:tetratricopeptide (TPR) repeat protein